VQGGRWHGERKRLSSSTMTRDEEGKVNKEKSRSRRENKKRGEEDLDPQAQRGRRVKLVAPMHLQASKDLRVGLTLTKDLEPPPPHQAQEWATPTLDLSLQAKVSSYKSEGGMVVQAPVQRLAPSPRPMQL
jgi:hypothetical protein